MTKTYLQPGTKFKYSGPVRIGPRGTLGDSNPESLGFPGMESVGTITLRGLQVPPHESESLEVAIEVEPETGHLWYDDGLEPGQVALDNLKFVEVKTNDLSGRALDWAIAQVMKYTIDQDLLRKGIVTFASAPPPTIESAFIFSPTTQDAIGLPVLALHRVAWDGVSTSYLAPTGVDNFMSRQGPTRLISGLRVIVGCNLGEVIDVPAILVD